MSGRYELRRSCADVLGPLWPELGVHVVFFSLAQSDEVFARVLLESYEGVAVARAHDAHFAAGRTLLSLLVVPDATEDARRILAALAEEVAVAFHRQRPQWIETLRRELGIAC